MAEDPLFPSARPCSLPLRVDPRTLLPPLFLRLSGGSAAWCDDGLGGRRPPVYSRDRAKFRCCLAQVAFGSRVPDPADRIWGVPSFLFLDLLLRWQELVQVRWRSWGISDNKAAFSSFSLACPSRAWSLQDSFFSTVLHWLEPVLERGGSSSLVNKLDEPSMLGAVLPELWILLLMLHLAVVVAEGGEGWPALKLVGVFLLHIGVHYMVALDCRHALWLRWQPLQMPMWASFQPPSWRPFRRFPAARSVFPLPSGFVPGEVKDGCQSSLGCCGGEEGSQGSDCIPFLYPRVFHVNCRDCVVIVALLGSCLQNCTPPLN